MITQEEDRGEERGDSDRRRQKGEETKERVGGNYEKEVEDKDRHDEKTTFSA